jgi:hypothetical protein
MTVLFAKQIAEDGIVGKSDGFCSWSQFVMFQVIATLLYIFPDLPDLPVAFINNAR